VDATGTIHVVRGSASGLSALDQARAILRWELPLEPQLGPYVKLLDGLASPRTAKIGGLQLNLTTNAP
jgi:hypothetical protein